MDVGSLISGSSAFSKSWLNIWKFSVHALLKPSLENFEHYLASMWNESNYAVVWTFFGIAFLWEGMKTELSQSCSHCWVFQIYWYTDSSNFKASSFRIINRSAEIPSPPLALFVVMLPACIQITQEAGKVVWYSHFLRNFPQFIVSHTIKDFNVVYEAELDVFL